MSSQANTDMAARARCLIWLCAWLAPVGCVAVTFGPWLLPLFVYFPTGLLRLLGCRQPSLYVAESWAPYILLTVIALMCSSRRTFSMCLLILCLLFLLNGGGCVLQLQDGPSQPYSI